MLRNTIVASNSAVTDGAHDLSGTFQSLGNNLIGNSTGASGLSNGSSGDMVGSAASPLDPRLGPMQNNGGFSSTRALGSGSPAIDAGNSCVAQPPANGGCTAVQLLFDQRGVGFPRLAAGAVDIGAFEGSTPTGRARFDYNRDGRTDVSVFRPSTGIWYLTYFGGGLETRALGQGTDRLSPADFDGDGKTDVAVFRPSEGIWYVMKSTTGTVHLYAWGSAGDTPVPGDFDGDGSADLGVFRPAAGQWWIQLSGGGSINGFLWGQSGDIPLVGNFDGDSRDDIAIYRPNANILGAPNTSGWIWSRSSDGQGFGVGFGRPTDRVAPGDYDGDGRLDVAVMRPTGNEIGVPIWYILRSNSGYTPGGVYYEVWGVPSDVPVPGDYDGDGRDDVAVWRSSTGEWWIQRSTGGFTNPMLGQPGDIPTPRSLLANN